MANQKHQPPLSQHERIERLTQSREHWRKRARAAEKRLSRFETRIDGPGIVSVKLWPGTGPCEPAIQQTLTRWNAPGPDEATDTLANDIRELSAKLAETRGQLALWQFFGYSMSALAVLASCAWIYERFAV